MTVCSHKFQTVDKVPHFCAGFFYDNAKKFSKLQITRILLMQCDIIPFKSVRGTRMCIRGRYYESKI